MIFVSFLEGREEYWWPIAGYAFGHGSSVTIAAREGLRGDQPLDINIISCVSHFWSCALRNN
jgi:hypothetical protein